MDHSPKARLKHVMRRTPEEPEDTGERIHRGPLADWSVVAAAVAAILLVVAITPFVVRVQTLSHLTSPNPGRQAPCIKHTNKETEARFSACTRSHHMQAGPRCNPDITFKPLQQCENE